MTAMGLTERQQETLFFLAAYQKQHGTAPTFAEICAATGASSNSRVSDILIALEARGYIRRLPRKNRAIEILVQPKMPAPAIAEALLPETQAKLAAFCARNGENAADVLHDAILLHIDSLEARLGV